MKVCEDVFYAKMREIEDAIKETGLDPYAQLSGYIRTGSDLFITSYNDARAKIKCLDVGMVQKYILTKET